MSMSNEVHVRPATDADIGTILPMMAEFNRLEEIEFRPELAEPALRTLLSDESLGVVGLVEDVDAATHGATLGYFVVTFGFDLEWNGRDAFLTELFLVPAARGRKLGDAVLAHAEDTAARHHARALHLMVRNDNGPAFRLYERAGYVSPPRIFMTKVLGATLLP
jgi:ribosomal protein S18 acetylase RimI-like enzyme